MKISIESDVKGKFTFTPAIGTEKHYATRSPIINNHQYAFGGLKSSAIVDSTALSLSKETGVDLAKMSNMITRNRSGRIMQHDITHLMYRLYPKIIQLKGMEDTVQKNSKWIRDHRNVKSDKKSA